MVLGRREISAALLALAAIAFYLVLLTATPSRAQNVLNCRDFQSQAAAQAELKRNPSDSNNLDADNDGVACETFPYPSGSPTDFNPVQEPTTQTTQITFPITTPTTNSNVVNQGGGVTATVNPSPRPRKERSIVNIPNKPLPPVVCRCTP